MTLMGDLAIVPQIVREKDLGHAPGADLALERVAVSQRFLRAIEAGPIVLKR
jgi:hypothetical protein